MHRLSPAKLFAPQSGLCRWVLACVLAVLPCPAALASTWRSFSTAEFDVIGDASLADMRRTVSDIETYRYVFQKFAGNLAKPGPIRPRLFILSHASFQSYVHPARNVLGLTAARPFSIDVMVEANDSQWMSTSTILQHELTHYYMHLNSTSVLPSWFDEGMAEFFSTVDHTRHTVTVGKVLPARWLTLQSLPWMPLQQFIALHVDADHGDSRTTDAFYAQAWLLIHYCYLGDSKRLSQLMRVQEFQNLSLSAVDALQAAFPNDLPQFEKALQGYAAASSYRYAKLPLPELTADTATAADIPAAKALTDMALLMLRLNRDPKHVLDLLGSIGPQPDDDRVAAAAALAASRSGAAQAATLRAQCRANAQSAAALMLRGEAMLTEGSDLGNLQLNIAAMDPEMALVARQLFQRALGLEPDNRQALIAVCVTYAIDHDGYEQLIPKLEQAIAESPNATPLRQQLARLYIVQHRLNDAKAQLEHVALVSNSSNERAWAIRELQSLDNAIAAEASRAAGSVSSKPAVPGTGRARAARHPHQ